jgi:hypothetical protein
MRHATRHPFHDGIARRTHTPQDRADIIEVFRDTGLNEAISLEWLLDRLITRQEHPQ